MWARGTPDPKDDSSKFSSGGSMAALINGEISSCDSVPELDTVFMEYSGSFNYINASAALVKYAKLRGSSMLNPLFSKLATVWLKQLPQSDSLGLANVLWVCGKLGSAKHPVWAETWQAYQNCVSKALSGSQPPDVKPQEISNALYAAAKLRQQPQPDELVLLVKAFVQPTVLAKATSQAIANVIWSLGLLSSTPGWKAEVNQELLQQLLAPRLLASVTAEGVPQAVSNVLVGLSRMCTGSSPLLSTAAAQEYAQQLLSSVWLNRVSSWNTQSITNAMWAMGEFTFKDEGFLRAAVAAAPNWLLKSTPFDLAQAATACAQLQYQDEHFMRLLLQRGQQMLQLDRRSQGKSVSQADKATIAALCCSSVAHLDLRGLAGLARSLVADSSIGQQSRTHPSNMRRLWVFHSWLLEHQLLDGKGLAGLVTEQQLQQGEREAAKLGDKPRL
jgi:hypothetical protein